MINLNTLERKAKETLEFLSNNDQSFSWNIIQSRSEPKSLELTRKRMHDAPNPVNKPKRKLSTADFTGKNIKNLIVPKIVTFEQCPQTIRGMTGRSSHRRQPKKKHSLCTDRTLCTIQSSSLEQQVEGIDFMKFWVRHRFEQKSIDSLISRIESNRRKLREMRA